MSIPSQALDLEGVPIPAGAIRRLGSSSLRHTAGGNGRMGEMCFSPDGTILATTAYDECTVCLWVAETGRLLHRLDARDHGQGPRIRFSPDSKWLVSIPCGKPWRDTVQLWDVVRGEKVDWPAFADCRQAAFCPTGERIVGCHGDTVTIWDRRSRQLQASIEVPDESEGRHNSIGAVALLPSGQLCVVRGDSIALWNTSAGTLDRMIRPSNEEGLETPTLSGVVFTRDYGLVGGFVQGVRVLRSVTEQELKDIAKSEQGYSTRTRDGQTWLIDHCKSMRFWELRSGKELTSPQELQHTYCIDRFELAPDGKTIGFVGKRHRPVQATSSSPPPEDISRWTQYRTATISNSPEPRPCVPLFVWNLFAEEPPLAIDEALDCYAPFEFTSDSNRVLTLRTDGRDSAVTAPALFDSRTGDRINSYEPPGTVSQFALSPVDNTLALACRNGALELFDLETAGRTCHYHRHTTTIEAMVFSPDGSFVVTATPDCWKHGTIIRWDTESGRELDRLETSLSESSSLGLAVTSDARYVAVTDFDRTDRERMRVFDWQTKECVTQVSVRNVERLYFLAHSHTLAVLTRPKMRFFDLDSATEFEKEWPSDQYWSLPPFLPDGRSLHVSREASHFRVVLPSENPRMVRLDCPYTSDQEPGFTRVALSSNGLRIGMLGDDVVDGRDGVRAIVWDSNTGAILSAHSVEGINIYDPDAKFDFAFDSRNRPLLVVLTSSDPNLLSPYPLAVWDCSTGEKLLGLNDPIENETGSVDANYHSRVAFSPDGNWLALTCDNRTLLWDVPALEGEKFTSR